MQRLRVVIRGAVQGVGFRPFVYRLATRMGLAGQVRNSPRGVFIEAEGEHVALDEFLLRLGREKPALAFIQSLEYSLLEPAGLTGFQILASEANGETSTLILPDIATCPDCLAEMRDSANRRYRYPFINCTHCGPRYSIIEALPYDRPNTSMKIFPMCPDCQREYDNPGDRRFHAQPTACPVCGPQLELWDEKGRALAGRDEALRMTAALIRQGKIAAVKGLGGFHLICDARNADAVECLRRRKQRVEKPFALMYPSLETIGADCRLTPLEQRLLSAPEAPIVLLERYEAAGSAPALAESVATDNPYLGVMLPATPLHHLLLGETGSPVVATSGNLSDEPICIDEREALARLAGIADIFLVQNRPIVRHVDDSIVRIVLGRELVLRRARGYAPLPLPCQGASGVLAVGGQMKNTIAVAHDNNIFISQHIGDLENQESMQVFQRVAADMCRLYRVHPARVAADLHPDYLSTQAALASGLLVTRVQHHHAHVAACMAENELDGAVLGVAWDGTGYGPDGVIWGGEFLSADRGQFQRVATLRPFRLPGGEAAVREPRRVALGVLHEIFGRAIPEDLPPLRAWNQQERALLTRMLERQLNAPLTSSAGRLFDAVAALTGLRQQISYEGQAAMELEFAARRDTTSGMYPFDLLPREAAAVIDWEPMIAAIVRDVRAAVTAARVARKFHNTLAAMIVAVARRENQERVVLTGGCFQNRILLEEAVRQLREAGFRPFWPQRLPPGDGGIAAGQLVVAASN